MSCFFFVFFCLVVLPENINKMVLQKSNMCIKKKKVSELTDVLKEILGRKPSPKEAEDAKENMDKDKDGRVRYVLLCVLQN